MTHYKVLGIDPSSSADAIRMAYFNRVLTLQKLQKDPILFEQQFMQVRRSYEVLSDEKKRKKYDSDFERGLPGTSLEESADTFNIYLRSYFFKWDDFSTFPQEFRTKKIVAELFVWTILFIIGACFGIFILLGGDFDPTDFGNIVTVIICGGLFAAIKDIVRIVMAKISRMGK
jgi:curved DNA-binding protein CbpA